MRQVKKTYKNKAKNSNPQYQDGKQRREEKKCDKAIIGKIMERENEIKTRAQAGQENNHTKT